MNFKQCDKNVNEWLCTLTKRSDGSKLLTSLFFRFQITPLHLHFFQVLSQRVVSVYFDFQGQAL